LDVNVIIPHMASCQKWTGTLAYLNVLTCPIWKKK
jgi:hypothetical protein